MKKRILAGITAVLLLAGCFAGCSSNGDKKADTDGTKKLRVLWWGTQARHDSTIKVLDMYKEKNEGVEFEPEFMGYSGYYEKIATLAAANNWPDIMQFDMIGITPYIRSGRLLDLGTLTESGALDLSDVPETVVDGGRANGTLYALPLGINTYAFGYKPEVLKKAGIEEISREWTWDDLEEICAEIVDKTDIVPTEGLSSSMFHYYLRQKGKTLYNSEGTGLGYDDDNLFVEYFDKCLKYIEKGWSVAPEKAVASNSIEDSEFAKGNVAFAFNWSNSLASMQETLDIDLKLLPMPGDGKTQAMYTKPTLYFAVAADTKEAEEAGKFLSYFINDIEANTILNADRGVPVSSKVQEALKASLSPAQQNSFEYIEYVTEHSTAMDPLPPECNNELETLLTELDEQMMFGRITTKDAAAKFRKEAEAIFARSK